MKKLCKEWDLNFDDVMTDIKVEEFKIICKRREYELLLRVVARYAILSISDGIKEANNKTFIVFKTTKEKYIETINAFSVLRVLYKKEENKIKDAIIHAFQIKHDLFYSPTPEELEKIKRPKIDLDEVLTARLLASKMETAKIFKALPGKTK